MTTPEESIAAALEASAVRAQRRGGYTMQAAFLTRAAELSPASKERALRYLAAAQAHLAAGDGPLAEAVLDLATPDSTTPACTSRCNACALRSRCSSPSTRMRRQFC